MLQYVLMALVVIGMFIMVIISAKNYSPTEWILLALFLVVIALVGAQYFFGTNVSATLKDLLTPKPQIKIDLSKELPKPPPLPKIEDAAKKIIAPSMQTFHVPGQYNYTDAKALCRAYGGNLANIEQMMEAHKDGAEWCEYGWSDDQLALYPTQMKTWQKFKDSEIHKKDCGRPGINGGYTTDLEVLLGANCFAPKPPRNGAKIQPPPFPKDPVDEQVDKFKGNLPNVSAFNYEKWDK